MPVSTIPGAGITTSTTLTTPIVSTTMGVGGATPSTSGSGITFPASQSASTDANTLDDYEEGTWTPTVTSATGSITSYTVQTATYTKIGRSVTVNVQFTITNNGTGGFRININNSLPFATQSNLPFAGAGRENAVSGFMVMVECGNTNMLLWKTDNSYPGGTNFSIFATCTYFV
jgi:hypothetical protein